MLQVLQAMPSCCTNAVDSVIYVLLQLSTYEDEVAKATPRSRMTKGQWRASSHIAPINYANASHMIYDITND
jgi:hypothetical protein